jgi:hypothetical protein
MYQINTNCTKWSLNIPNVHKIFQMAVKYINSFQSEDLEFFSKLGFFGLKTNHLATLTWTTTKDFSNETHKKVYN